MKRRDDVSKGKKTFSGQFLEALDEGINAMRRGEKLARRHVSGPQTQMKERAATKSAK